MFTELRLYWYTCVYTLLMVPVPGLSYGSTVQLGSYSTGSAAVHAPFIAKHGAAAVGVALLAMACVWPLDELARASGQVRPHATGAGGSTPGSSGGHHTISAMTP